MFTPTWAKKNDESDYSIDLELWQLHMIHPMQLCRFQPKCQLFCPSLELWRARLQTPICFFRLGRKESAGMIIAQMPSVAAEGLGDDEGG